MTMSHLHKYCLLYTSRCVKETGWWRWPDVRCVLQLLDPIKPCFWGYLPAFCGHQLGLSVCLSWYWWTCNAQECDLGILLFVHCILCSPERCTVVEPEQILLRVCMSSSGPFSCDIFVKFVICQSQQMYVEKPSLHIYSSPSLSPFFLDCRCHSTLDLQ